MATNLEQLNDEQRDAVTYFDTNLRIIAGAGSGKTRVITEKMKYIIDNKMAYEWEILAITFTNKATREMNERLGRMINHEPMVNISTYHSFCLRIIREEYAIVGLERNFNIVDGIDKKQMLKRIMTKFKEQIDLKPNKVGGFISTWKREGVYPKEIRINDPMDFEKIALRDIYQEYELLLKERNSIDMDDIIYVTDQILDNQDVLEKWAMKYKYILVDEFQDTDEIQFSIIQKLSKYAMLTVVGDPDQTIYTWRGAKPWILTNLQKEIKDLHTIILNVNYRSSVQILNVANRVIGHNGDRIKKDLFSNRNGELPYFYHAYSQYDETCFVAHVVNDLIKKGVHVNEISILFRAAYSARQIEQKLVEYAIPYQIYGGIRFYEREEIKDAVAYLKVLYLRDQTALLRVINTPSRKIGDKSLGQLIQYAQDRGLSLWQLIFEHSETAVSISKGIQGFIDSFLRIDLDKPISHNLDVILKDSGYLDSLIGSINEPRRDNLKELRKAFDEFQREGKPAVDVFSESILSAPEEKNADGIKLMTIHAAKGLEFEHVFVISLNESTFPSSRSIEAGALDEERRLFYVAATRAKKGLYLTSWNGRNFDGSYTTPSRFIEECGTHNLQKPSVRNEPELISQDNEEEVTFMRNEIIIHDIFGEGLVLNYGDGKVQVAFKKPHGVKTLRANHKAIKKQR